MEPTPQGQSEREMMSPLERTNEDIRQLTEGYNNFSRAFQELFSGEEGKKLSQKVNVGRFTNQQINEVGVRGEQAQVVYGDWNPFGNMEGSLYTLFDGNILRTRWVGDHAIYLNNSGNYIDVVGDEAVKGKSKLKLGRIEGLTILGLNEQGVITQHPDYWQYRTDLLRYEQDIANRSEVSPFTRLLGKLTNRNKPEEPLTKPTEPENVIVPHEKVQSMLSKMNEGLKKTIFTLEEAKKAA